MIARRPGPLKDEYYLTVQNYIAMSTTSPITGRYVKQLREAGHLREASCAWAALALLGQRTLVTSSQAKLDLARKQGLGWLNIGLTLAPAGECAWAFKDRFTACLNATAGCMPACVGKGGHGRSRKDGGMQDHGYVARCGRTIAWAYDADRFEYLLIQEVRTQERNADYVGLKVAFRGDIASDWQVLSSKVALATFVKAYGYTKRRETLDWKDGVVRVLSRSERNDDLVMDALACGHNAAVVFDVKKNQLPQTWRGFPVINGDLHDLWFLHLKDEPTIVGLSLKGNRLEKSIARAKGFAVKPEPFTKTTCIQGAA